jgi:diaminopimelate decarboxylase
MHNFYYLKNKLHCEKVQIRSLAEEFGTPLYVYSAQTITDNFNRLKNSFSDIDCTICYSVKANSNLSIINLIAALGGGFDVVSLGELKRVAAAGGDTEKCVFAGVGKTTEEITQALKMGIYSFNIESVSELARINQIAKTLGKVAPISVRVNPNIDAGTHSKITTGTYQNKFGIAYEEIERLYASASRLKNVELRGVQMHIGSQLTSTKPFELAVKKMIPLVIQLKNKFGITFFSLGGGIGIVYQDALASGQSLWWKSSAGSKFITPEKYAEKLLPYLRQLGLKIILEPGRFIVGNAGILVTKVEYIKNTGTKTFVIVDAAMNDLIRPSFYDAYHEIIPEQSIPARKPIKCDVVGPICESGDFFCKDRQIPEPKQGELLVIMSAGAYCASMGSNYNSRPLPPEVLVNGQTFKLIRRRQSHEDIWSHENSGK